MRHFGQQGESCQQLTACGLDLCRYYLLTLEQDMVTVALDFVPMKEARILNEALEETVRQVFVLNGKVGRTCARVYTEGTA